VRQGQLTLRALRRTPEAAENFPQDVLELQAFLAPAGPNHRIQAVPAAGTEVPLWILGSSNFGAMLAAELGLPYAFASHFAPEQLVPSLQIYRGRFKPSEQLDRPYAMVGVNIIAAESDAEARRLATTQQMSFVNLFRGARGLSHGGRVARGSPARMPGGLPLPNTRSFKERVGALKNLWPFLTMVWRTSRSLTAASLLLRLARALLPVITLYVGKLITMMS
jgi:alkanesulfonate monooxygenase SsuD/methylene tetrahydromethanopterin reductase-like flavin-dependent oxidoreductase (luciferase family)